MDRRERPKLQCQVYTDLIGGRTRFKGVVTDGVSLLFEGKWQIYQSDAVLDADRAAQQIARRRRTGVVH